MSIQETFKKLVKNKLDYGDLWNLSFNYRQTDKITNQQKKRGWNVYKPFISGNLECGKCQKTLRLARVVVLFRYRLQDDRGTVIMRPFGQSCRRCQDGEFDRPGFSEDSVETTLLKLRSKIRKNCYKEEDDDDSPTCTPDVKTKPHEKALCEGCQLGICCQDDD